ncbi:hypothetical protein D3C74_91290 [compost metagenome]
MNKEYNIMNKESVIDKLVQKVISYAKSKAQDVDRGKESPRLAALLLQKYGVGVVDAAAVIFDTPRAADPIYRVLDEETVKIDPLWREHNKERWQSSPADLFFGGHSSGDCINEKHLDVNVEIKQNCPPEVIK